MNASQTFFLIFADAMLIVHVAFVVFVIVGLVLIWLGGFRGWAFVRNFWFRLAHLAAIGVVAAESIFGIVCPLTTWENQLRLAAGGAQRYAGSFVQHWLHRVLFFDFDERVFTITYIVFCAAVALSFWRIPPHWPRQRRSGESKS